MKYSAVAFLAAASSVLAQGPTPGFDAITAPTAGQTLKAGSSFEIIWEPNKHTGTITIHLLEGSASNLLNDGGIIASGVDNMAGSYVWDPVPSQKFLAYGFNITLDGQESTYQLSNGFHIQGQVSSSGSGYPTTTTTTTTSVAVGYPTSSPAPPVSYTTVSLIPGPSYSYSASMTTTTSCTTTVASYPTYSASANATWTAPSGTGYPTTSPAGHASSSPSTPVQGAAPRFAASGLAAIAGLVLAFAL